MPRLPSTRQAAGGRIVGQALFQTLYRTRVVDPHHVPSGPVLLAANHTGVLDGPLLFGVAPRPVHFLVKGELFSGPMGWVLARCGQIAIDRSGSDRQALLTALAVLARGGAVGVFPEGARGRGDVEAVHEGLAWLAMAGRAPIVPVACLGTRTTGSSVGRPPKLGREVAVVFGEPVHLDQLANQTTDQPRRQVRRQFTEQVRQVLADHVLTSAKRTGIPPYDDVPSTVGPKDRS